MYGAVQSGSAGFWAAGGAAFEVLIVAGASGNATVGGGVPAGGDVAEDVTGWGGVSTGAGVAADGVAGAAATLGATGGGAGAWPREDVAPAEVAGWARTT